VRVSGDLMTGAGIYPEDILIVERSLQAESNDVVIALLEGEFTVKRLVYEHGGSGYFAAGEYFVRAGRRLGASGEHVVPAGIWHA